MQQFRRSLSQSCYTLICSSSSPAFVWYIYHIRFATNSACLPCCCPQLTLRTLDAGHSAFLTITFDRSFFENYEMFERRQVQSGVLIKVSALLLGVPADRPLTRRSLRPSYEASFACDNQVLHSS